jgi:hypothetical protein
VACSGTALAFSFLFTLFALGLFSILSLFLVYVDCFVISVSCTVWESRDVKKADLSVLDISSAIIARVESMPENMDYFYVGK